MTWNEFLLPFIELFILFAFLSKVPVRKQTPLFVFVDVLALALYIILRFHFVSAYDGWLMLIRILYFCVFCRTRYQLPFSNGLFLSAGLSLILHSIILFYYSVPYLSQYVKQWILGDILFISLFRLCTAFALRQTVAEIAQAKIDISEYLLLFVSCIGYLFDINGFISGAKEHTSDGQLSIILFMYCFCTTLAALAAFWHIVSRHRQAEVQQINQLLQNQYLMWSEKAERDAAIHRMYHDVKKQINLIQNIESETGQELTRALRQSVERYSCALDTGDPILNTLLNEKANLCAEKQICFHCLTNFHSLAPVEGLELCAIVGNALDNAIEATAQIPDPEQRSIQAVIAQKDNFLVFRFENPYQGHLRWEQKRLLTTKSDKNLHGIGLNSIQYSAEKYGGAISIDAEHGLFVLKIVIPCLAEA